MFLKILEPLEGNKMLKEILKRLGIILFFIVLIAFLSAPITGIGWLITDKNKVRPVA